MTEYTARFAHLAGPSPLRPGQTVSRGAVIGTMGNTGASDGAHLHFDVVKGKVIKRYNLTDIANGNPEADAIQATYFADDELFGTEIEITTFFSDPRYIKKYNKKHLGYDVIPKNRLPRFFTIRWNRSMKGTVLKVVENDPGYGNYVLITFEA